MVIYNQIVMNCFFYEFLATQKGKILITYKHNKEKSRYLSKPCH